MKKPKLRCATDDSKAADLDCEPTRETEEQRCAEALCISVMEGTLPEDKDRDVTGPGKSP